MQWLFTLTSMKFGKSMHPYNHHLNQAIARKTSPHFLPSPLPAAVKRFWIPSPQLSFVCFPTSCRCNHSASFAYHSIFEISSSFCAYWQFVAFYWCSVSLCDHPFTSWWRFRLFLVGYYHYKGYERSFVILFWIYALITMSLHPLLFTWKDKSIQWLTSSAMNDVSMFRISMVIFFLVIWQIININRLLLLFHA